MCIFTSLRELCGCLLRSRGTFWGGVCVPVQGVFVVVLGCVLVVLGVALVWGVGRFLEIDVRENGCNVLLWASCKHPLQNIKASVVPRLFQN